MPAFAHHHLLDLQSSGNLNLLDRNSGKLDIVVPGTIIRGLVPVDFAGQGPAQPAASKRMAKATGFSDPGHELPGVVKEEDVRSFVIHGDLHLFPRLLLDFVLHEIQPYSQRRREEIPVLAPTFEC